jgi:hypothetical protein
MTKPEKYPAGHPPHDPLNGFRVGAFAGGIMGLLGSWLVASPNFIALLVGAVVGGGVGYWTEKRKQTH